MDEKTDKGIYHMMRAIGFFTLGTVALTMSAHVAGIRPNISESAPVGLWIDRPMTSPLHRGMMIGICPPSTSALVQLFSSNGTLPYGKCAETKVALLLKPVRALPGDAVRISHRNPATVNGIPLANTVASERLPAWPDGEYIVKPDEVWVFSSHSAKSFDSRYFGPVKIADIQSRAFPLLVAE